MYRFCKLSYMPVTFYSDVCRLLQPYLEAQTVAVTVPWVGEHRSEPSIRLSLPSVTVMWNVLHAAYLRSRPFIFTLNASLYTFATLRIATLRFVVQFS
jgi:hypothetical protein